MQSLIFLGLKNTHLLGHNSMQKGGWRDANGHTNFITKPIDAKSRVKKFFFLNKSVLRYLSLVVFFGKEIFDAMASIFGV